MHRPTGRTSQTTDNRQPTTRIDSVDALRGFTVAAMLLVNNPGTWSAIYPPLRHAQWHGWTPADLIFPFFLFIVGITTELSKKEPRGILRRGLLIVLCGLLLNAFPYFRLGELRWTGVLQRIGIVYIAAALISYSLERRALSRASASAALRSRRSRDTAIAVIVAAILLGYWAVLSIGPLAPADATIAAQVDRALIPQQHMWAQSRTWDPEGVLSTLPAIATALLGVLAAPWVRAQKVRMLTIAGAAAIVVGLAWGLLFPINKNLWSSSYVIFTAGAACVVLALWMRFLPAQPFVVFGVNPLLAFIASGAMARILGITKLQPLTYRTFFKPYFEPQLASLLWGLTFVLFWYGVLFILYRRRVFLRL